MERDRWLGVEVRYLAALAAIDRAGSFRGAAEDLGYVQSAVSQQIARLEDVVGTRLVSRSRGRGDVSLTPAGETLLSHAHAIVERLAAAKTDMERTIGDVDRGLVIGACESAATLILPRVLSRARHAESGEEPVVVEPEGWEAARHGVAVGRLDVAFGHLPLGAGPFEHVELLASPCMLVVAADSPLTRRAEPPTLEELAGLTLVDQPGWRFSPRLRTILSATGRTPRFGGSSNLNRAVQALVAAGVGAAVMPAHAVDPSDPGIEVIDMSGVLPPARLVAFWHGDLADERVTEFVAAAQDAGREAARSLAARARERLSAA